MSLHPSARPICKNCAHFSTRSISFGQKEDELYICKSPQNILGVDLVLGNLVFRNNSCAEARLNNGICSCGEDGKWYVPGPSKSLITKSKSPSGNLEDLL